MRKYSTSSIYRIVCTVTGEVYVGKTVHIGSRKSGHFSSLRRGEHYNQYLQRAYNEYGGKFFYFEILETNIPIDDIDERERFWIAHFDSFVNGFNGKDGGDHGKPTPKACTWNGITYPSIKEAAAAIGVKIDTMRNRIKRGKTCDDDLTPAKPGYRYGKPV